MSAQVWADAFIRFPQSWFDFTPVGVHMTGILPLNKPPGISSAGALNRIKRLLPRGVKIGHAGTLDPFATGVLIVLIGKATKLSERFMSERKEYLATIKLGATTETLDPESPERAGPMIPAPNEQHIDAVLMNLVGQIEQTPPAYSALKLSGRPAYKLARGGHDVSLKPRLVQVYAIQRLAYDWPSLTLRIECGRGTYIRALARDIGGALGTAGYLTALQRTRVGPFAVGDSATLEMVLDHGVQRLLRCDENVL